MVGHDNLAAVGNQQVRCRDPASQDMVDFLEQGRDIQGHTIADDIRDMTVKDARRQLVQGKFAVVVDDGVAGIGAALVTNDNIGLAGKHVGNLAFSFIAPVTAYNRFDHENSSFGLSRTMPLRRSLFIQ
jgi:hypothetical protein